jgi:RNA polymerase sigma-70 factor, ECF subfamily
MDQNRLSCPSSEERPVEDTEMIRSLLSGDGDALGPLFERYARLVFQTAFRVLRSHDDAEDVTQEVFLWLVQDGSNFDPARGSLGTWLFHAARSRSLHRRRWRNSRSELGILEAGAEVALADTRTKPERVIDRLQVGEVFSTARERLSQAQWETLHLRLIEGYSFTEVSAMRRERLSNTRHHYYRGLVVLRRAVTGGR